MCISQCVITDLLGLHLGNEIKRNPIGLFNHSLIFTPILEINKPNGRPILVYTHDNEISNVPFDHSDLKY